MSVVPAKLKCVRLIDSGHEVAHAAIACGLSVSAAYAVRAACADKPADQWATILADARRGRSGRRAAAKRQVTDFFWNHFAADWLRLEAPTVAGAYRRTAKYVRGNGGVIPPLRACYEAIRARLSPAEIVIARQGLSALDSLYPTQRRHVEGIGAMEWINGDGWPLDVFARTPTDADGGGGRVCRPVLWAWQCVASRKIVGWALGETESAELMLAALRQAVEAHGVPQRLTIDNTRAASARWLVGDRGRLRNRRLHGADGVAAEVAVAGVIGELGITVHHTGLVRTGGKHASGKPRHRGRGGSKPVERTFRWFADLVAKHPALAGHYTGRSPLHKPENYDSNDGAAWEHIVRVITEVVAEVNAEGGRQAAPLAASGESADACFLRLATAAAPRQATEADLMALMTPAETTRIGNDGTFRLRAGGAAGFGKNIYFSETLMAYAGQTLLARYDPTSLHGVVGVTDGNGRKVCEASCLLAAGFGDTAAALAHGRARRDFVRHHQRAEKARQREAAAVVKALSRSIDADSDDATKRSLAQLIDVRRAGTDNVAAGASSGAQLAAAERRAAARAAWEQADEI